MKKLSPPWLRGVAIFCAAFLLLASARAHTSPVSFLRLWSDANYLNLELTLNPFELTFFSELDGNRDGRLDPGEWHGQGENIARRILECIQLRVNDRPVQAHIAGLTQNYDSHHITVRAHYEVDARRATVTVESHLTMLTSSAHVMQVTCAPRERAQTVQLDVQSTKAVFAALNPSGARPFSIAGASASSINAATVNDTAVAALLGLLLVAGIPPAFFCLLLLRRSRHAAA